MYIFLLLSAYLNRLGKIIRISRGEKSKIRIFNNGFYNMFSFNFKNIHTHTKKKKKKKKKKRKKERKKEKKIVKFFDFRV